MNSHMHLQHTRCRPLFNYFKSCLTLPSGSLVNCACFARSHCHHFFGFCPIFLLVMAPCDFSAHFLTCQTVDRSKASLAAWDVCSFVLLCNPKTPPCSKPELVCITFYLLNSHSPLVWLFLGSFGSLRFQPGVYGTGASLDFSVPIGDSHSREFFLVGKLAIFCTADSQLPAAA